MKARRVKGLDPAGPLGEAAERIVRVRLDELCAFMPTAADPAEREALHDMRIAAKRLRYVLEIAHPCFGPYARGAIKPVKALQELLGDIHDCDVQLPEVRSFVDELVVGDALAMVDGAPAPPNRDAYAGLLALTAELLARRERRFGEFLELWRRLERDGFRPRLEFALAERAGANGRASIGR